MTRRTWAATVVALSAFAGTAVAGDWPHWRGPNFDGSSSATGLPTDFSKTDHVRWRVPMKGQAEATPIVWGDKVFITLADPEAETLLARCLDRATGEVKWEAVTGTGYRRDRRSTYAAPSPVTDGERVIFFYSTGELIAFDMEGRQLWERNIQEEYGEFSFLWTFSTSPTLYKDRLFLQVLQRDEPVQGRGEQGAESYLLAIDPTDGETLYRHVRPSQAVAESREAFTTPIPFEHEGRAELLVAGGDDLTGHDPQTGEELWRWGTWNPTRIGHWRLVPSPVAGGGVILAAAPKGDPIYAVPAGLSGTVDYEEGLAWYSDARRVTTDVPTPLFYEGDFFVLSDIRGTLSRVTPQGEVVWSVDVPTRPLWRASPTGADGRIWTINHAGEVFVHDAGNGELVNRIPMGEEGDDYTRSTIVAVGDELLIRTNHWLYCIGE